MLQICKKWQVYLVSINAYTKDEILTIGFQDIEL